MTTASTFPPTPVTELEVELDAATHRLWIEGWRMLETSDAAADYRAPDCDDAKWGTQSTPNFLGWRTAPGQYFWARTRLVVPATFRNLPVQLILGGWGVTDFRSTRVFLNGRELAPRTTTGRWFTPTAWTLSPDQLRFGEENVIALQLTDPFWRTARLDEVDPHGAHTLPGPYAIIPPYEQCLVAGTPSRTVTQFPGDGLQATVTHRSADDGRVRIKSTTLRNIGDKPVRLLRIGLGTYETGGAVTEGEMGIPVYAGDDFFFSLDHPAGWAKGENGVVRLEQYPGTLLAPGAEFTCMNVVLGIGGSAAFRAHLEKRMRRVVRGHDRPLAMFELFGSWETDQFLSTDLTEEICLRMIGKLDDFQKATGQKFDLCSIDFWCDQRGDMTQFKQPGFPAGFGRVRAALEQIGVAPALWLDSSWGEWCCGHNPAVEPTRVDNASYPGPPFFAGGLALCRATEPFRGMYTRAFLHHLRENGARLFKYDNLRSVCYNQQHAHLPGIYSTQAIYDGVLETLRALAAEQPDVFLIGYWGYRSPWWLLDCDMLFECGLFIEASSPSPKPSLYARDGVSVTLDQGTAFAEYLPLLGKDSLGVWLSNWPWNSSIGKERWPEGVVLDLCRGSLLIQPWSDADWLTPDERKQFAEFMQLLRARPDCFRNPQLIIGDPWKNEPYGYLCRAGHRAFVAVNNFAWSDREFALPVDGQIFRHYPSPARLSGTTVWLRPFDVALYEIVPAGESPTGAQTFPVRSLSPFAERSCTVSMRAEDGMWRGDTPSTSVGGTLVVAVEVSAHGRAVAENNMGQSFTTEVSLAGNPAAAHPVLGQQTYPAAWQAWRITIPSGDTRSFQWRLTSRRAPHETLTASAHFIPA